ncbi:MAG: sterol desaturase family protein [Pseudomonadota bacterium]
MARTSLGRVLVFDLTNYAAHRWMHSNAWLWPLHAVHHSDTDLHFLSTNRAHILEWAILFPASTISAFLFGLSINDVLYLSLLRELHQYYVHSKLDWSHGPFRYVLVSPQYHRWHHVDQPEAYNKNFAFIFPFIDLIFGTYRFPGSPKDLPTGFEGNPGNQFTKLLAFPFAEWRRLLIERFVRSQKMGPRSESSN